MTSGSSTTTREGRRARSSRVVVLLGALVVMAVLTPVGEDGWDPSPLAVALIVVAWLPLLLLDRAPWALVLAVAADALHMALRPPTTPLPFTGIPVATMIAVFALAGRLSWRRAMLAGAGAGAALLAVGLGMRDPAHFSTSMYELDLALGAAGAGALAADRRRSLVAMEERAVLAERTRSQEVARHVTAERVRIARELHDVLAHHLTLVNAQASVAHYLLPTDPERAGAALAGISAHTRQALDELRATVGLLRQDDDAVRDQPTPGGDAPALRPVPGLGRLDDLAAGFTAAGTSVAVLVRGAPRTLSAHADLAAYRIVQEALTNASKHAPRTRATVVLAWRASELDVTVSNDAPLLRPAGSPAPTAGTGHGLIGMRERALAVGGTFEAAPRADGGFAVRARIPCPSGSPSPDEERPDAPALDGSPVR